MTRKAIETPETKLARWYEGQNRRAFDAHDVYNSFQAGNGPLLTFAGEHYEKHYNEDETAYIIVLWSDDNGIESIG